MDINLFVKQIRIGTILQWKDNKAQLAVDELIIVDENFWRHILNGDIIPIYICKSFLDKLGFAKIEKHIYMNKYNVAVFVVDGQYSCNLMPVTYVHELQNVYLSAERKDLKLAV